MAAHKQPATRVKKQRQATTTRRADRLRAEHIASLANKQNTASSSAKTEKAEKGTAFDMKSLEKALVSPVYSQLILNNPLLFCFLDLAYNKLAQFSTRQQARKLT